MHGGTITSGRACTRRRRRRVLDQLDQLVAEDDAARRRREVATDLERRARRSSKCGRGATSATRLASPCTKLAPSVAIARSSTSGLVAGKFVGRDRVDVLPRHELQALALRVGQRGDWRRARSGTPRAAGTPAAAANGTVTSATPLRETGGHAPASQRLQAAAAPGERRCRRLPERRELRLIVARDRRESFGRARAARENRSCAPSTPTGRRSRLPRRPGATTAPTRCRAHARPRRDRPPFRPGRAARRAWDEKRGVEAKGCASMVS